MNPLTQAITALRDIELDLMRQQKYLQSQDSVFSLPYAVNHVETAVNMIKRIRDTEDALSEKLFDIEKDISEGFDYSEEA